MYTQAKAMPVGCPALGHRQGSPSGSPQIHADMLKPWEGRKHTLQWQLLDSYLSLKNVYGGVFSETHIQAFFLSRWFPIFLGGHVREEIQGLMTARCPLQHHPP